MYKIFVVCALAAVASGCAANTRAADVDRAQYDGIAAVSMALAGMGEVAKDNSFGEGPVPTTVVTIASAAEVRDRCSSADDHCHTEDHCHSESSCQGAAVAKTTDIAMADHCHSGRCGSRCAVHKSAPHHHHAYRRDYGHRVRRRGFLRRLFCRRGRCR